RVPEAAHVALRRRERSAARTVPPLRPGARPLAGLCAPASLVRLCAIADPRLAAAAALPRRRRASTGRRLRARRRPPAALGLSLRQSRRPADAGGVVASPAQLITPVAEFVRIPLQEPYFPLLFTVTVVAFFECNRTEYLVLPSVSGEVSLPLAP